MSIANVRPFIPHEIITDSCSRQELKQLNVVQDCVSIGYMNTSKEAFARRLNTALDAAGFPGKGEGRQKAVSQAFGVTGTAAWKWMEGESMPASKRIQEMAKLLGVRGEWLFTGSGEMKEDSHALNETLARYSNDQNPSWHSDTKPADDDVEIPKLVEVQSKTGLATEVKFDQNRKQRVSLGLLARKGVKPECAAWSVVTGNSMEPVMPDGTVVRINTAETDVIDGKMYALDHHGMLRFKLLYRIPGGGIRIRSYNDSEWPSEDLGSHQVQELSIIGRIFWYSAIV